MVENDHRSVVSDTATLTIQGKVKRGNSGQRVIPVTRSYA